MGAVRVSAAPTRTNSAERPAARAGSSRIGADLVDERQYLKSALPLIPSAIPVHPIACGTSALWQYPPAAPRLPLQRKLAIGDSNDPLEAEADAVTDGAMRMAEPSGAISHTAAEPVLRRKCACEGSGQPCVHCKDEKEKRLMRKAARAAAPVEAPAIVHDVLQSPGQPLDWATRAFAGPRLGHDFSGVRVHTDARASESAQAVNALAYTVGNDLVFRSGQYAPHTPTGRRLILHELAHVLQQRTPQGAPVLRRQNATATDADPDRDKIVAASKGTGDLKSRAQELVRLMLNRFFPEYAPSVAGVTYQENEPAIRVLIKETGPKDKRVQSATVIVGKHFVESTSDDTLRERIEELRNQLAGLNAPYDPQSTGAAVWAIINNKLPKKAGRLAGTSYDANLPGLRTEYGAGGLNLPGGSISWSSPILYFGKAFLALPPADQEAKLRDEFVRIDKWVVDNFQVTKEDLEDGDITLRIRGLSNAKLTEFRDKVKAPEVKDYADSLLTISTPMESGLTKGSGGTLTTVIGGVTVIVMPDISNAPKVKGGETTPTMNNLPISARTKGGVVTSFTGPPAVTITIQTKYGPGASAEQTSGYGRGTTDPKNDPANKYKTDKELGGTTLRVHEGSHGLDFLKFIKENPFPVFTGSVGMTAAAFTAAMQTYKTAVEKWKADIAAFSKKRTDCVGLTIDTFYQNKHEQHPIECAAP